MRNLLLSSILLLMVSCTVVNHYPNYQPYNKNISSDSIQYHFNRNFLSVRYKAEITILDNYITGILLINKTGENQYRINLVNEFGVKFLDFLFEENEMKVIYCNELINRNIIIRTLQNDFSLLLAQQALFSNTESSFYTYQNMKLQKLKLKNTYIHHFINAQNELTKSERYKKNKLMVEINFNLDSLKNQYITISHKNFNLSMNLNLIKKE